MHKNKDGTLQVVTANDLVTGAVVYLSSANQWVTDLAGAEVFDSATLADSRIKVLNDSGTSAVGIDQMGVVRKDGDRLCPKRLRDRLRQHGPSILYSNT